MSNKLEEATTGVMGAAKVVKATFKGLKGVFRTLMKQHGEASSLLGRLQSSDTQEDCRELWPRLRGELLSHERAEIAELYPLLRADERTRQVAEHHDQEAAELELVIAQLHATDLNPAGAEWKRLLNALGEMVAHHVGEEESKWFSLAQEVIGDDEAERLDEVFALAKDREMLNISNPH